MHMVLIIRPSSTLKFQFVLPSMSNLFLIKGTLSGLRQFLATESPLKMIKNAFNFTLKTLFVLKIFKFLS